MVSNLPANAGDVRDTGSIPRSGRSPGRGHSNPIQYSCLENPMDRGAWQATVHGVATVGHDSVTNMLAKSSRNVHRNIDCWFSRWRRNKGSKAPLARTF